nr:aldose epimerase family protein [Sphingomonas insulae]
MTVAGLMTMVAAGANVGQADAATATREAAGTLADGTQVEAVTLTAKSGVVARILSYGATLQRLSAPDRDGKVADVLLGYDDARDYAEHPNFFGVTVGRYANRIGGGRFTLDGKAYTLPLNDKVNSLHGGTKGFDKQPWRITAVKDGSVTLALTSADGDQGYPGKLDVTVTYALSDDGALTITFGATTDKPTVVNMTNHAIFNLAGEGSPMGAMGHRLTIPAKAITPVDANLIPTGALRPVAGTVFDFRGGRTVADGLRDGRDPQIVVGRGYDHNFALDKGSTATPGLAARLEDPASGRVLEVSTTEPGVQFYTGNFLDGTYVGKGRHVYRMGDGIALEPQKFPDSPNKPAFASPRVDPGKPYRHVMIYKFSVAK